MVVCPLRVGMVDGAAAVVDGDGELVGVTVAGQQCRRGVDVGGPHQEDGALRWRRRHGVGQWITVRIGRRPDVAGDGANRQLQGVVGVPATGTWLSAISVRRW